MPSKVEELKQIGEAHKPVVDKMIEFVHRVAEISLKELETTEGVRGAIQMYLNGVAAYPDRVFLRGRTMRHYNFQFKQNLVRSVSQNGPGHFQKWIRRFKTPAAREELIQRIVTLDVLHFVEAWYMSHSKMFPEPDWEKLETSHQKVLSGRISDVTQLYGALFYGIQAAAIEVFVEDTAPPDAELVMFLTM
ncbi:MAG: hypothetical protein WC775_06100 [Patescibacteria group bacterium]|jgi:hypothetical protein